MTKAPLSRRERQIMDVLHRRRRSAAERHLLWTASLAAATLLPLLRLLLPEWQPGWMIDVMAALPTSPVHSTVGEEADIVVRAIGIESPAWVLGDWLSTLWIA